MIQNHGTRIVTSKANGRAAFSGFVELFDG